jgi:hypothetical protein
VDQCKHRAIERRRRPGDVRGGYHGAVDALDLRLPSGLDVDIEDRHNVTGPRERRGERAAHRASADDRRCLLTALVRP